MPLPFYVKSSPAPAPKTGQGPLPAKPAQQKTSTFGYLFKKPSTNQGQSYKTLPKTKIGPGFLEKGGFRKVDELIHEVKKGSYYKSVPTYSKKFTQAERESLVKDLVKAAKGSFGLTGDKLGMAIKKLEKEKRTALSHWDFKKVKVLDPKIKQAQAWKKAWDRPKQ